MKLMFRVVCCLGLVFGLVVLPDSARSSVITSGNIDPAGIGGVLPTNIVTRQDPWNVSGNLAVGDCYQRSPISWPRVSDVIASSCRV